MLDLQVQAILDQARAAGAPDFADLPPQAARGLYSQILAATDLPVAEVTIEDRLIDGPGGALNLRLYHPRQGDLRGAVLYLHGGGFVVGCARDYDGVVSRLCELSGCLLVQVDYRLAPEHPFPAAVHDCYAALRWLSEQAGELGLDADRIVVAGDSAGANLAAVCALLARDRDGPAIRQQTLIYPVTAPVERVFESYGRYGEGYTLTVRSMGYFSGLYLSGPAAEDFRAAPLAAQDLASLPPALVLVAGFDPLRDEGIAYADALNSAGTPAVAVEYAGLAHGFISMAGAVDAAGLAVEQVAAAWRRVLPVER